MRLMRKTMGTTLVLGVICSLMLTVNNAECFAEEDLAAYWSMDEGKGDVIKDKSGNNSHGKIHGAVWVEGKYGKALKFDGIDDYVDCGNDSNLNITDAITIEAWVKLDVISGDQKIVSKTEYQLGIFNSKLEIIAHGTSSWAANRGASGGTTLTAGQWYHVVGVYDGAHLITYVNGNLDRSGDSTGSMDTVAVDVLIGAYSLTNHLVNGTIDEVKIYDRALSQEEIEKRAFGKQILAEATILRSSL